MYSRLDVRLQVRQSNALDQAGSRGAEEDARRAYSVHTGIVSSAGRSRVGVTRRRSRFRSKIKDRILSLAEVIDPKRNLRQNAVLRLVTVC